MRTLSILAVLAVGFGCSDTSPIGAGEQPNTFNNGGNGQGGDDSNDATGPELEADFEFAQPAVVGTDVFVANESLNSIAVIDSRSLAIRTLPVGFNPTKVVGPAEPTDGSRVWVLNEGSSSVSIVDPQTSDVTNAEVLRRANAIATNDDGTWAIAWVDPDELPGDVGTNGSSTVDLSAVSLVRSDGASFSLAVGYRVERVVFAGDSALVLTDDGVSVVQRDAIDGDTLVAPIALLPVDLQQLDQADREVVLDPAGEWAVARVGEERIIALTELSTGSQWVADLPGALTDLDWVPGDAPRVLGTSRDANLAVLATIPAGLIALSEVAPPSEDMGAMDMGDMGDVGNASDMDMALDMGADMADADVDVDVDSGPPPMLSMPVPGVWYLPLDQPDLGAAEVAPNAANALFFSTVGGLRRAVLLDLESLEQRGLSFEKGVRGAIANDDGTRYVVLHTREDGQIPQGASPSDPEFIARSWGLSIVDVETAATRLVLTERKPGQSALWPNEPQRLYMIFEEDGAGSADSLRDVLRLDLGSFSSETFRVPSMPEGIGRIDGADRIFVNQEHPQGRLTFIEVASDRRQTVTGYQLNAGID